MTYFLNDPYVFYSFCYIIRASVFSLVSISFSATMGCQACSCKQVTSYIKQWNWRKFCPTSLYNIRARIWQHQRKFEWVTKILCDKNIFRRIFCLRIFCSTRYFFCQGNKGIVWLHIWMVTKWSNISKYSFDTLNHFEIAILCTFSWFVPARTSFE